MANLKVRIKPSTATILKSKVVAVPEEFKQLQNESFKELCSSLNINMQSLITAPTLITIIQHVFENPEKFGLQYKK